ncbi:MAG: elongation factor P [Alphaproteobacteria bacterium]|nr:elongation factor P [Alphaproteobacteria bacterium]
MKINGNAIRPGMIILHNDKLYKAVKTQHVKPGKGGAYAQVELKDVISGNKLNERFRSDESVERVVLEQKECTFSYIDGDLYMFMDNETFEQIPLAIAEISEDQLPFIKEGIVITIEFYEEKAIGILLPPHVIAEVVETEAVIKGQTASSSYKPAILDNGVRIMVPPHIEAGTRIVVNTESIEYVERAKD